MAETKSKQEIEEKARQLAEPIIANEGMELIDVEFVHEREGWVLRLFIDKPGGVGLEDCSTASRAVDTVLEVEDFVPQAFHLEVSSPGLNRPLTKPDHFKRAIGKKIKIKTYGPVAQDRSEVPRKNFSGVLKALDADALTIEVEGAGAFHIPFKDIAKANLEFEF